MFKKRGDVDLRQEGVVPCLRFSCGTPMISTHAVMACRTAVSKSLSSDVSSTSSTSPSASSLKVLRNIQRISSCFVVAAATEEESGEVSTRNVCWLSPCWVTPSEQIRCTMAGGLSTTLQFSVRRRTERSRLRCGLAVSGVCFYQGTGKSKYKENDNGTREGETNLSAMTTSFFSSSFGEYCSWFLHLDVVALCVSEPKGVSECARNGGVSW